MLLKRKPERQDMADVNVYTANRLKDMADSLSRLARSFSDEGEESRLTREDAKMAMQTAASMVCGDCGRCSLPADSEKEDSYYLYYLLRAFEQNGKVQDGDMPRLFLETCARRESYMRQLNRNLGRAAMNLTWKNRFLESRDAVIVQFRELALILEEFSRQMEAAANGTEQWAEDIRKAFRRRRVSVDNLLVLEYENKRREAYLTLHMTVTACMTASEAAGVMTKIMDGHEWHYARDSRSVIGGRPSVIRLVETGSYQMLYGAAWTPKAGQKVSGDNYTFVQNPDGQVIMSLSD